MLKFAVSQAVHIDAVQSFFLEDACGDIAFQVIFTAAVKRETFDATARQHPHGMPLIFIKVINPTLFAMAYRLAARDLRPDMEDIPGAIVRTEGWLVKVYPRQG